MNTSIGFNQPINDRLDLLLNKYCNNIFVSDLNILGKLPLPKDCLPCNLSLSEWIKKTNTHCIFAYDPKDKWTSGTSLEMPSFWHNSAASHFSFKKRFNHHWKFNLSDHDCFLRTNAGQLLSHNLTKSLFRFVFEKHKSLNALLQYHLFP